MTQRIPEIILALIMAIVVATMTLFPAGPTAEELELEVVNVRKIPGTDHAERQLVEVQVRWRWLQPPTGEGGWNLVSVGKDHGRWSVRQTEGWHGVNGRLLTLVGQPKARWGTRVEYGEDGEQTFVLVGRGMWNDYGASAITLEVHYIHQPHGRLGWPRRTWVRTVAGTYPLTVGEPE